MITYQFFVFTIKAEDIILLPAYKGSTFRGGFGNAFRKVVCALKKTDCSDCILKEKCVYSYVFETPPPSDTKIMTKYTNAPHPFIIEPPSEKRREYKTGDEISFGLTLIGRAIDYLPYFVYTFDELGKMGIGKGRGTYELKTVRINPTLEKGGKGGFSEKYNETIYSSDTKILKQVTPSFLNLHFNAPQPPLKIRGGAEPCLPAGRGGGVMSLTLSFLTPARIIFDNHLTLDLEFHMLIRQLLRRISLLSYFHCNGGLSEIDFRGIIKKSEDVKVKERKLRWHDWERYSARQDTRMKMGGFVGEITFEGEIGPFMPLIKAGEVLHVGKGTSFGLGKYNIK